MTFAFEFYQVPKTVMEDREIEVPRQVYETVTRTVQRPKTVMEDKIVTIQEPKMVQVPRQVCPYACCLNYTVCTILFTKVNRSKQTVTENLDLHLSQTVIRILNRRNVQY